MKQGDSLMHARSRGFTLVELIIVMAILSIVMLAITSFIIPTQQSMKMQSNVTDVQANLNLAMNVLTKDLLMAGFLVDPAFDPPTSDASCPDYWKGDSTGDDMAPGAIFWQGDDITEDNNDLTIRTRILGNAFAVVDSVDADTDITSTHADMFNNFCNGNVVRFNNVRVFNPVGMKEVDCTDYPCEMTPAAANVLSNCSNTAKTFRLNLPPAKVAAGMVVVGTSGANALPMHTIRYRVNNGALERIVNGTPQILARGITSIAFAYEKSSTDNIKRVDVTLTGGVAAMKSGDVQLSQKTRTLITSVHLRNSF